MNEKDLRIDTADISNRTYEQYADMFCLEDASLAGKQILDLAGGLSDFSARVNEKYGETGTVCRSVDTSYAILAELKGRVDHDSFNRRVQQRSRSTGAFDYRRDKDPVNWDESHYAITKRLNRMRIERKEAAVPLHDEAATIEEKVRTVDSLPQVAGSADRLPLKDGSMDLVFSSNYLLYPMKFDRQGSEEALEEALRVLNQDGELRIFPPMGFEIEGDKVTLNDDRVSADPDGNLILYPYQRAFEVFTKLEEKGVCFYLVENDKTDILVLKKNEESPTGLVDTPDLKVRKLMFAYYDGSSREVPYSLITQT